MQIAEQGKAKCMIFTQHGASSPVRYAAAELARFLRKITGADFEILESSGEVPEAAIIIGSGAVTAALFPEVDLDAYGMEQLTIRTRGNRLLLAGGEPRGTLYAVYGFLEQCGMRWWTPWATHTPSVPDLTVGSFAIDKNPAFESRDVFSYTGADRSWMVRNKGNGRWAGEPEQGGKITYKGFVHTFSELVPSAPYFERHPEWFSLIDGKRTHPDVKNHRSQLCTTNPQLREFLIDTVRQWLIETPEANIVSISQNDTYADWSGACECPPCKEIDEREGSHAGTIIDLLNHIAGKLGPEYPRVAFDTLAYRYTRQAPRTVKPLPNVIVRLCSIECNFAVPLEDPSNAAFAKDIMEWSKICDRLYVWDYVTNFSHYLLPHPNWFSLGPNIRFFERNRVRGIFEQGAFQSFGADMAEMRNWVLAQLLWDSDRDDRALIREFLEGYFGQAASFIGAYLELMYAATAGKFVGCYEKPDAAYLDFETLYRSELLWQQAEAIVRHDDDLSWRVKQGHLAVLYAFLANWDALREQCTAADGRWPIDESRDRVAEEWLAAAIGDGPEGWEPITHLSEIGLTPQAFIADVLNKQ